MSDLKTFLNTAHRLDSDNCLDTELEDLSDHLEYRARTLLGDAAVSPADKLAVVTYLIRREWDALPLLEYLGQIEAEMRAAR